MRIGKGGFRIINVGDSVRAAMTADELVNKNVAARGGMDSLQAIKSLRLSAR
jgi:hypothetical protein